MQTPADMPKISSNSDREREWKFKNERVFYDVLLGTFHVCWLFFPCFGKVNSFYCRWNLPWGSQFKPDKCGLYIHKGRQGDTVQMCAAQFIAQFCTSILQSIHFQSETDVVSCVKRLRMSMVALILNFKRKPILAIELGLKTALFPWQSKLCIVEPQSFVVFEI